jgi:upstream activation factor subunit UAF30
MPRKATASNSTKKVEKKSKKESKSKSARSKTDKSLPKSKKTDKVVEPVEEPVLPPVEEPVEEPEVSDVESSSVEDSPKEKKKRRVPTKESVVTEFDKMITVVQEEIDRLREAPGKQKGVKFLRSLNKHIKTLRGHSVRVMKQKQKTNRKNNTNSGFLKPVQLSKEMAKFTGWDHNELRSRVDVTKYICNYIHENNLQNPDDRRQILADKKLTKLLEYDSNADEKPLTYYRIQTYMKKHFSNPATAPAK